MKKILIVTCLFVFFAVGTICATPSTSYITINGVGGTYGQASVTLPDNYPSGAPYKVLIACHGAGGASTQFAYGAGAYDPIFVGYFVDRGWIVVGASDGMADSWGNQTAINNVMATWNYIKSNYNVESKAYLFGWSMGGIVSLNTFVRNPNQFVRWAGYYPVSDLDAMHSGSYQSAINSAYGCDNNTYSMATSGFSPILRYNDYANISVPMAIWHGGSDNIVSIVESQNLQTSINTVAGKELVSLTTTTGGNSGHGFYIPEREVPLLFNFYTSSETINNAVFTSNQSLFNLQYNNKINLLH